MSNWLYHPPFPPHWERVTLYSMARWVNGLAFRNIAFSATGRPVIKIAEIKGGISDQTKFTHQIFDDSVRVRSGDLLFSWSGQPETSIDAFWWRGPEGWLNQHVFRVTPNIGINITFFFYILRYLKSNFVAIARNKQTTGLGHVTKRDLENIEVAFPDLSEQHAIAHILGTLDDKIELNRRMNETLEAMARAIFKDWFVDFGPIRAKAEGREPYLAPEVWNLFPNALDEEDKPVEWIRGESSVWFNFNPHETIRRNTIAPYLDMAALPTIGAVPDLPTEREYKSGAKFRNGDTLFARITPCLENGKTAYVFWLGDGVVGAGSTEFIVIRSLEPIPKPVSYLLARDTTFRAHAERSMTGTSGRQRASVEALGRFEIIFPKNEHIWRSLGDLIDPLIGRIVANAYENCTLTQTRDLLLPKLISGEIRIADAEKMAEAVA